MPIDAIDKQPQDISGDPKSTQPLTPKAMAGAQKRQVNRTQLGSKGPAGAPPPPASANGSDAQSDGEAKDEGAQARQQPAPGEVDPNSPILGGVQAIRAEADAELHLDPRHFNPLNAMDWAKQAAETPVETYHLGRHIWDAFYGAFFGGISPSIQNIQAQDDAYIKLHPFMQVKGTKVAIQPGDPKQEAQVRDVASMGLQIGANPLNLLPFGQARGAAMVAAMLTPTIAQAIFSKSDPMTTLTWGGAAALLFGGKLPPAVEAKLAAEAPAVLKVFDKISATQRAQDATKVAAQDRKALLEKILVSAQPARRDLLAPAWGAGMESRGKDWEQKTSAQLMKDYGSLDRDKIIEKMYAGGASQAAINSVWTYLLKMDYPLLHIAPGEAELVNPVSHLPHLPAEARAEVEANHHWAGHMANQGLIGPAGNAAAPEASHWRSLIGMQETNKLVGNMYEKHLLDAAGAEAQDPRERDFLMRALEGDQTAYQSLSPQLKYVRDTMRQTRAALRLARKDSGFSTDARNNYAPRVHALVSDGKKGYVAVGSGPLATAAQHHRELTARSVDALTETRIQVEQRYPTVQAAQQAVVRLQKSIAGRILGGVPAHEIPGVPETDWNRIEQIRAIQTAHPDVAAMEADNYSQEVAPDFSLNPFDGIRHDVADLRSITAYRAVESLLNSIGKDGRAIAIRRPMDSYAVEQLGRQGYTAMPARGFAGVLVNSEYAELLKRAMRSGTRKGLGEAAKSLDPKALAELEGKAVATIMYSPRFHGLNMGLRLGMLGIMHPIEITRWFKGGLMQKVGEAQIGGEEYRMEAWRARVIPPHPGTSMWADEIASTLSNHTGDTDLLRTPLLTDLSESGAKASSGAKLVAGKVKDLLWGKQSELWSWVSDFGVMAYHIELGAAKNSGRFGTEAEASAYAARRANSWMGHVAPEDTNPAIHAIAKTVTFAPNYWRTWGELLTGVYKRAGWGWSDDTIRYVVQNEIKTALAAVAFQQLSANALNIMLSGHTIYQNDPGNWGKVEITRPEVVAILNKVPGLNLGIDGKTGRNAKGQKLTMENPVARQVTDTEQMLGLLTSSPHWSTSSLEQGSRAFAAGRLSPVVDALGALANVDIYASIASGGTRYMDPNQDHIFGNPALDAVAALASLTPFSYISNQIQQSMLQGDNPAQDIQGPFGTHVPKVVSDTVKGLPGDAARMLLVGMTGTNPPYMRSSKTFGVQPTDDQYKAVHEIQDTYTQNMNGLSTAALGGQLTPAQWIAAYRQLSTKHADQMQAIFKHAPEYNNGPLGLTNSWEGLYDQASQNGITNADKLRTLQRQWRNEHPAADYAAVQSELRVSDQKYPMLALYHKTLDAYDNWQSDYCKANGVDLETLRTALHGYSQVYGDRQASQQWLADHPIIQPYENAKKGDFESGNSHYGQAGLMYALFFNPTGAERYLSGQTAQQVEQAVQAEQVPAAP